MANKYTVPESFFNVLTTKFDSAVKSGDLVFTPSEISYHKVDEIDYVYSVLPGLKSKPNQIADKKKEDESPTPNGKDFDPFDPPAEPLVVLPTYAEKYAVVLNKFAVVPKHFLLITKKREPQSAPLEPSDLTAAYHLLRAANKQSGKRHIGFFNCGVDSGASIDHRHIQFLQLPESTETKKYEPWPDHIAAKHRNEYTDGQKPISLNKTPFFSHFIVPISSESCEQEIDEHLGFRYSTLLSRVLTCIRNNQSTNDMTSTTTAPRSSSISYNLVFTEEWMMAVPRTAPDYIDDGVKIGVNAVGTVGLLLAKSENELNYLKEKGPMTILQNVTIPFTDRKEDVDYDY